MTCCQSTEAVSYWFEGIIKKAIGQASEISQMAALKKKAKKNDEKKKRT